MARKPFLRTYNYAIPANGQIGPVAHGGRYFICKESDGVFKVTLDDVGPNDCEVGYGFKFSDENGAPAEFKRVTLHNTTASVINVVIQIGSVEVLDSRLNTLVDRTINVTVSDQAPTLTVATMGTILSLGTVTFTGLSGAKHRLSFSAFNRSANAGEYLIVVGNNGIGGHEIDPRQAYAVQSGGAISLSNPTGVTINYRVMETFLQ